MKGATVYQGPQRVILSADRAAPIHERSVFVVTPLLERDRFRMSDEATIRVRRPDNLVETIDRGYAQALDACVIAVTDVENFPSDGPLPYPKAGSYDEKVAYLAQLTMPGVYELGRIILDAAYASAAEKNS